MDIWNIAKTVGSGVLSMHPIGATLIEAANAFLPDDKKLPNNATGNDLDKAMGTLSAEQKTELLSQEYNFEMTKVVQGNQTLQAMLSAEQNSPHSTRPQIAYGCFCVLAFMTCCIGLSILWGVVKSDEAIITALGELTLMLGAVTATFAYVLKAYFGVLSQESRDKQNAANGFESLTGVARVLKGLKT